MGPRIHEREGKELQVEEEIVSKLPEWVRILTELQHKARNVQEEEEKKPYVF